MKKQDFAGMKWEEKANAAPGNAAMWPADGT
jgi:hypothetical protein